ncbi:hypothetical protein [Helicobacter pylori]|nr:hypothetical protein [Helicobacter pylori]
MVSGKLGVNLNDSFLKSASLGGLVGLKGGEWFQMLPISLRE